MVLRLVVKICVHRNRKGRYYLIENPAGSVAWALDWILSRLLQEGNGKFIICDQCAYGKVDQESRRPIKKPTGFLANDEILLNHPGKRCKCKFGAHQQLFGSNRFGQRSSQAAAYPAALCKALCVGILESMKLEYALHVPAELAHAAGDYDDMLVETPPTVAEAENDDGAQPDEWESKETKIILWHYSRR